MNDNPWAVDSINAFTCPGLKCPECIFFTKYEGVFESHAKENHPLSSVFFDKFKLQRKNDIVFPNNLSSEDLSKESKTVEFLTTSDQSQWNWEETDGMSPPNFCQYRKENNSRNRKHSNSPLKFF